MNKQDERIDPKQFPFRLDDVFGEILMVDQPYPDVYHIAAKQEETDLLAAEYYIVLGKTKTVSQTVKEYGKTISEYPEWLVYPLVDDKSGWRLVDYEGRKYLLQNQLPLSDGVSFHEAALYDMEYHPEYFGEYPVPIITPAGYTLRHKKLDNGIYWLETDRCEQMLAVCCPVWSSELSDVAQSLGQQVEYDQVHGIDNTLGYLFFSERASCIALFELLRVREDFQTIRKDALMNAVWQNFPEYAAAHNLEEQSGMHDVLGQLMNALGVEVELHRSTEHVITISQEAGTDFICW